MLLFERYFDSKASRRFYACSASRDRKECNFFQWENETPTLVSEDAHRQIIEASKLTQNQTQCWKRLKKVKALKESKRRYCHTCEQLVLPKETDKHGNHELVLAITDRILSSPSFLLKPVDKKKSLAQYLCSPTSVDFLLETFETLGYKKILCVGTPRVHEAIQIKNVPDMSSILLDLDHRYAQFNKEGNFIHYNMFNHHFFEEDLAKLILQNFLKDCKLNSILVVLDPPFGGLVEVLAASIKKIWNLASYCKGSVKPYELATFWIFPYFMESRIVGEIPSFKMCEFRVDYENHPLYKKPRGSSAKTSPVRVFTNVPLREILLPKGYRYCEVCQRYVSEDNVHCELCNDCTAKDGRVWLHCSFCGKCVKKGRIHCQSCDRCELPGHDCHRLLRGCHICGKLDHKRKDCSDKTVFNSAGNKRRKMTEKSKKRKRVSE